MRTRLYWAYGANLSFSTMARRCPRAEPLAPLVISYAALVFRGEADVTLRKGSEVQGGLWSITPECESLLDRYEGVLGGFYLKRYLTIRWEGGDHECLFYQMRITRGVRPPSEVYFETLIEGYRDFGLDAGPLDDALIRSWEEKNMTPYLKARYERQGRPRLAKTLSLEMIRRVG